MKKEMLLAIFIGLGLGLLLTYGFYLARNTLSAPTPSTTTQSAPEGSASPSPSANSTLALVSPEDEVVLTDTKVTVAGTTIPNAQVVIFVNNEESLTTADASGNFSSQRDLQFGSNVITVYSVDTSGNTTTVERTVVVADPEALTTQTASPSATPRASSR